MENNFRRNAYFRLIYSDRKKYHHYCETYFTEMSIYLISWKEFYSLCVFPEEEKQGWEEFYRRYYIKSKESLIDSHNGCEIDTFKYLKVNYHVLVALKDKFPDCYVKFLRNYQIQLLVKKYHQYMRLAKSQRLRIENSAFNYINSTLEYYNSLKKMTEEVNL